MGMAHAVQKGEMKAPSAKVAKMAKTMKKKHAKEFASTKHKGLPYKKKEESITAQEIVARLLEEDFESEHGIPGGKGCEECGFEVCPACGGEGAPMGALGNRVHYRCRDCGIDFSRVQNDKPVAEPKK